jgi:hypothetical protein
MTVEQDAGCESGRVDGSDVVHGVRPTISGYRAWCGAGDIVALHRTRFDLRDRRSCPLCTALLRATVPSPRPSAAAQ